MATRRGRRRRRKSSAAPRHAGKLRSRRAPHGELLNPASRHLQIIADYLLAQSRLKRLHNETKGPSPMTYQLSSYRRFPSAFAIVAASALAFTGLIASTSPAYARDSQDYRCTGLAED